MRKKPMTEERKRHVTKCLGVICPDRVYTVEGVMRAAGWGPDVLIQARASGLVKPISIGRRIYYLGRELVQWIESLRGKSRNSEVSHDNGNGSSS